MTSASRIFRRARLALLALFLLPAGVAMAATDPAATPGFPWQAWLAIGLAAIGGLETVLRVARAGLTWLAPRTKMTADDRARDFVGKLDDDALALLRALLGMVPVTATSSPTTKWTGGVAALLALVLAAGVALQPACSGAQRTAAGHAVVDCAKADALPILVLVATWGVQSVRDGHINWQAVEAGAIAHGELIGGCAVDRFVAETTPKPTMSVLPGADPGAAVLARLRTRWGVVEWRAAP